MSLVSPRMNRRCFVAGFLTAPTCVIRAAQPPTRMRRIGLLLPAAPLDPPSEERFWAPLAELGWVERKNLIIERRHAQGRVELLQGMAEELVRVQVELIVALGTVAGLAAERATQTVPIVVHRTGDPVRTGLVENMARPGGNVTGTSALADLQGKRVELIRELLPRVTRIGELTYSPNPIWQSRRQEREVAYRSLGMEPVFVDVTRANELELAVAEIARQGGQVLVLETEPFFSQNADAIVQAAQRLSLPVMGTSAAYVGTGVLIGFGPSEKEYLHTLASIVDKVLRGARPAELPFQQPTKFDLTIDLRAAKALGVTVPRSVLIRATEVLQ